MLSIRNIDKKNTINVFRMVKEMIDQNKTLDFSKGTDKLVYPRDTSYVPGDLLPMKLINFEEA